MNLETKRIEAQIESIDRLRIKANESRWIGRGNRDHLAVIHIAYAARRKLFMTKIVQMTFLVSHHAIQLYF